MNGLSGNSLGLHTNGNSILSLVYKSYSLGNALVASAKASTSAYKSLAFY